MIVRSFDGLRGLSTPPTVSYSSDTSLALYGLHQAYAEIYRTQPNVRICVDFLGRNIAQLALHVFRRTSETDRRRLADHDLARWVKKPNPGTSRYRLMESLMGDLGVYFNAFWLKVRYRQEDGRPAIGLVRLPPDQMQVEGGLLPSRFLWMPDGRRDREREFAPSEIVYFNGYNPLSPLVGLAPLETLRRILAEEAAAGQYREQYWSRAGRQDGIWELTKDAPNWTDTQKQAFRQQWQEYAGAGAKAGMTAVGPKGAVYKAVSFSARDSEYILGGKLRREVCAAAYHIPQPMVGILDHATYSNVKEQHKQTYQDTLAPWLEMLTEELERQLLIECEDQDNVYTEFNIAEKLKGSFEEQASALQAAVGRPWMKVNEARARMNLPHDDDPSSDQIAPQQGGPSDATANPSPSTTTRPQPTPPDEEESESAIQVGRVLEAWRGRVESRLARVPAAERVAAFDGSRWSRELAADLTPLLGDSEALAMAARLTGDLYTSLEVEALDYA